MSPWPLALQANHPAKPPLILRKDALELAISYAQECFRVAQSLADVADQSEKTPKVCLPVSATISGHILKIPLQSREFLSVSSCRHQ